VLRCQQQKVAKAIAIRIKTEATVMTAMNPEEPTKTAA
jgi:hypothetical protein